MYRPPERHFYAAKRLWICRLKPTPTARSWLRSLDQTSQVKQPTPQGITPRHWTSPALPCRRLWTCWTTRQCPKRLCVAQVKAQGVNSDDQAPELPGKMQPGLEYLSHRARQAQFGAKRLQCARGEWSIPRATFQLMSPAAPGTLTSASLTQP